MGNDSELDMSPELDPARASFYPSPELDPDAAPYYLTIIDIISKMKKKTGEKMWVMVGD